MTTKELEKAYDELQERLLQGELDDEAFKNQVEKLRFEDSQGRQWKIGWYTGKWYRYDEGQWIQDEPPQTSLPESAGPAPEPSSTPQEGGRRRPLSAWLVPVLVGLLAVAALMLVWGWSSGWWSNASRDATLTPEPTEIAQTEPTLPPEPSAGAPTASPRASATASPTAPATAQPTAQPSQAPSDTPPLPTVTDTAVPTPTEATEATSSPAAAPALRGRIYYPVFDPDRETFDIYAFELVSGERQRLLEEASQPALSPSHSRLAFRSWNTSYRNIRVLELDENRTWTWINHSEAARPNWSPDSQNLVFPSQQEPDRQWRLYHTMGLEFDRVRRHGGDILGRVPAWMKDGRIVYWECPQDKCGLYAMQSDGTSPVRLTNHEYDTAPAPSPDSSKIAFMSNFEGNWEVYVTSTQGLEEPERLTQNPARDGLPTWSPDGEWLAFVSDRGGPWAIWAIHPDGSGLRKLFDLGGALEGQIHRVDSQDQHGWTWEGQIHRVDSQDQHGWTWESIDWGP
jgi:hypothetical protein